ncbi:MAG: hypothetical protein KF760_21195 [Candidatus Eremiobacteraeota bacterium]|nr:hypothetical protein [Candidatus Eremiobacteraeota bacterium]MCW5867287.1 hypothetical protein [Candidatus Eremiobacteraeota bacterium]
MITPLESLRSKYHLTRADLLNSLVNRAGEPVSERTLSGLLAGRSQLSENTIEENSKNLADTIKRLNSRLDFEDVSRECRAALLEQRRAVALEEENSAEASAVSARPGWSHYLRTLPQKGEPAWLGKARKLSDSLQSIWSDYLKARAPQVGIGTRYVPEEMGPKDFLEWADAHFAEALERYEQERDLTCGKWFLLRVLSWTELACHRLQAQLSVLNQLGHKWRTRLAEARTHLSALNLEKDRRIWLEFCRLENLIQVSEHWVSQDDTQRRQAEELLKKAEQNSSAWMRLYEEVDGSPSFAIPDSLIDSPKIRAAIRKRWQEVVDQEDGNWPEDYDPFAGFVICHSPLWPMLDAGKDAMEFELMEALDILLLSTKTKQHLFYVLDYAKE